MRTTNRTIAWTLQAPDERAEALMRDVQEQTPAALLQVADNLAAARAHLAEVEAALAVLAESGMYPAVPSEQWQSRNGGEAVYLYMLFGVDQGRGGYCGPQGRRKVYVGCGAERIAEARRLAENRCRWEALTLRRAQLASWIDRTEEDAERIRDQAVDLGERSGNAPSADLRALAPVGERVTALGPESGDRAGAPGPNESEFGAAWPS